MTKFMVLYRSPISAREQMANTTPEQAQGGMDAWMNWASKAQAAIVDLGAPLAPATSLGPAIGETSDIAGFSILQAPSIKDLADTLSEHPHLGWGGSIEVLEFLAMPGG